MTVRKLGSIAVFVLLVVATMTGRASTGTPSVRPIEIDDSQLQPLTVTMDGGVSPLPTTRTIPHWWDATLNPQDGIMYGYNMVGANPNTCIGAACDVTVQVDITPIILNIDGLTFSGNDVLGVLLASPQFALNDFGFTPYVTTGTPFTAYRGPGGILSQDDAGIPLQLEDATMRAQFNKTGAASSYHLRLQPNVLPTVTIDVPDGQGFLLQSGRGAVFAGVQLSWWAAQLKHLEASADPTHLALYLTDDVVNIVGHGNNSFGCCILGFHSADAVGVNLIASAHSNGNAPVQTFAWASWLSPGIFARPNGGNLWDYQDMSTFNHEISEWADDPFASNHVEPWPAIPGYPQYGCINLLETGDGVGSSGFAVGTNTFRQGPNPNGTQSADGYYHAEDEVMLPWFMRIAPNFMSEPTQNPSPNVGRYTFMGSLNTFPGLDSPPVCP